MHTNQEEMNAHFKITDFSIVCRQRIRLTCYRVIRAQIKRTERAVEHCILNFIVRRRWISALRGLFELIDKLILQLALGCNLEVN